MTILKTASIAPEDWFDQGKTDAWLGRSKSAPEHDPNAASWYDLGYGEGVTQPPPLKVQSVT